MTTTTRLAALEKVGAAAREYKAAVARAEVASKTLDQAVSRGMATEALDEEDLDAWHAKETVREALFAALDELDAIALARHERVDENSEGIVKYAMRLMLTPEEARKLLEEEDPITGPDPRD